MQRRSMTKLARKKTWSIDILLNRDRETTLYVQLDKERYVQLGGINHYQKVTKNANVLTKSFDMRSTNRVMLSDFDRQISGTNQYWNQIFLPIVCLVKTNPKRSVA